LSWSSLTPKHTVRRRLRPGQDLQRGSLPIRYDQSGRWRQVQRADPLLLAAAQ